MSGRSSLCLTCLSNTTNGVSIPTAITEFLCNTLQFKCALREDLANHVCLPCYRTLSEMKRFYVQLQDVEHYFNQTTADDPLTKVETAQSKTREARSSSTDDDAVDDEHMEKDFLSETEGTDSGNEATDQQYEEVLLETEGLTESTSGNPYRCEKCFRIFDDAEVCRKHFQWHLSHEGSFGKAPKEKKFECETCGKRFFRSAEKRAHEVTHTDLRPFKCEVCAKTFRQVSGLSVHRAVHFGKKVECPKCFKRFATKYEVIRHMNVHRNKTKSLVCDGCTETFWTTEELHSHKLCSTRAKCEICEKTLCNKEALDVHVSIEHLANETDNSNDFPKSTMELLLIEEDAT